MKVRFSYLSPYGSKDFDIYTKKEYQDVAIDGVIDASITVRGEQLFSISGIKKVSGTLGLCNCLVESLGQLEFIGGDFWISSTTYQSRLTSLERLKRIEGNCTLRYSNIESLSDLEYVGGNLSLRDTPIKSLDNLKFVGGNLFLPKRLKDNINISNIEIVGNIKYWNDSTKVEVQKKSDLGLTTVENIPEWRYPYAYSENDIALQSDKHIEFFARFMVAFNERVFYDLEGNNNYAYTLHHLLKSKLLNNISNHKSIEDVKTQFKQLLEHYPDSRQFPYAEAIEAYESINEFEIAFELMLENGIYSIQELALYEIRLSKTLFDSDKILHMYGLSGFTEVVLEDIDTLRSALQVCLSNFESDYGSKFLDIFFDRNNNSATVEAYHNEHYQEFFEDKEKWLHSCEIIDSYYKYDDPVPPVVYAAIGQTISNLKRNSENMCRESKGLPKVGEGWVSETKLYYELTEAFPNTNVVHHGKPAWLGRQHFDIYMPEHNIAIEYQGKQHYEPVDFFGGEEAFKRNLERDRVKKRKAIDNSCDLIYVDEGYILSEVLIKIKGSPNFAIDKK